MADVSKIKLPNNTTLNVKDSRIPGVDSTPTSGSTNVVTSGGVATALGDKYEKPATGIPASDIAAGVIPSAPGTLNTTATTAQTTSSSEALSGNVTLHKIAKTGTYSDLVGKPTVDSAPTSGSSNLVTSGGVYTALDDKVGSPTIDNIVELTQAQYDALTTKDPTKIYIVTDSSEPSEGYVSIADVDVHSSSEPGGENVTTITLTNGQEIEIVTLNGQQGNTGSSVAYPYELVNNVVTNDATKGLSAQMGKYLNDNKVGTSSVSSHDLEISDEIGNILALFSGGHFKVKNFDTEAINSNTVPVVRENPVTGIDFSLSDEDGSTLVSFENGHIRTKNFYSGDMPIKTINKAVFMGDSITHGVYSYWNNGTHTDSNRYNGFDLSNLSSVDQATAYHGIHYYFGLLSGANVVNLGKRGTGWVADTRSIGNALQVATNYNFSDVDFVALCFGVNDYIQGMTLGDISTRASGTVIGNMCSTIEKILTDNPLCKVVVYSPYNTWGQVSKGGDYTANTLYGSESTNYALGYEISGNTLQDIIDAEEAVCDHYGIQIVNLSKSNVCNRFTLKEIMVDGLHPTKASYPKLAAEIYGKGNFGA